MRCALVVPRLARLLTATAAPLPAIPSQIALRNYDPQKDKRFTGSFRLPLPPRPSLTVCVLGKGGVGKTSVAASVGSLFAELRRQDHVVAIDADPDQIARAAQGALHRGVQLDLRMADLTVEVVDPPAAGALLWFTTFGFLSDKGNARVLEHLRGGLLEGAALVIDTLDPVVVADEIGSDPESIRMVSGDWVQEDVRRFDPVTERLVVDRTVRSPDSFTRRQLRLWLPQRQRWPSVLDAAGFDLVEVVEPPDDAWAIRLVAEAR